MALQVSKIPAMLLAVYCVCCTSAGAEHTEVFSGRWVPKRINIAPEDGSLAVTVRSIECAIALVPARVQTATATLGVATFANSSMAGKRLPVNIDNVPERLITSSDGQLSVILPAEPNKMALVHIQLPVGTAVRLIAFDRTTTSTPETPIIIKNGVVLPMLGTGLAPLVRAAIGGADPIGPATLTESGSHVRTLNDGRHVVDVPGLISNIQYSRPFPESLRNVSEAGIAVMQIQVSEFGIVDNLRVLKSDVVLSPEALEQLRSTVTNWRFRPFEKDGRQVRITATFPVTWDARGRVRTPVPQVP